MLSNTKRASILLIVVTLIALVGMVSQGAAKKSGDPAELGELLYFDTNLSEPSGQACASCHEPTVGFDDPDDNLPVSEGVNEGLFGGRNSPASAYAMYAPVRYFDDVEGLWIGGQFWDSRATGEVLGDPLADQALGPFLNPVEMANTKEGVIDAIKVSSYADLFEETWGEGSLDNTEAAYDQVALSIAAFERTGLFAEFSSKYDAYLQLCLKLKGDKTDCAKGIGPKARMAGRIMFSDQEWYGLQLFMGENDNNGVLTEGEGAFCSACHVAEWIEPAAYGALDVVVPKWSPDGTIPPVFTDFTYDNLGLPKNPEFPLEDAPLDLGLGAVVGDSAEDGKFKVMTLRNIAFTGPYMHNGLLKTLEDVVHFYNTRDVQGAGWDAPEVPDTMNMSELGNLGLSPDDEAAVAAFMRTLSDHSLDKWRVIP